jgi:hypothetical protein
MPTPVMSWSSRPCPETRCETRSTMQEPGAASDHVA